MYLFTGRPDPRDDADFSHNGYRPLQTSQTSEQNETTASGMHVWMLDRGVLHSFAVSRLYSVFRFGRKC